MHADTFHKRIHTYTCTHRDTDACLDGCTHNVIEVDKILLKDDCEDEFHLRLRDVFSNGGDGPALHECTDACRHLHGQAGPYISMRAPDTAGIVPNVTPKIVALTYGQRLGSNLEENRL